MEKTKMKTTKEKQEEIEKLKQVAARLFGDVYSICKKKNKVMQFHHTEYDEDKKTHRDFENNLDYQSYILPIVISRPQEFEYLCRGDHWSVTRYSKTKSMRVKLERLVKVVRNTIS